MSDAALSNLNVTLDREKRALLAADFAALAPLIAQKKRLLNQLILNAVATEELQLINARITENQTLLAASIRGVAAARDRLAALQSVKAGLGIYDQSGQRAIIRKQPQSLEKKA